MTHYIRTAFLKVWWEFKHGTGCFKKFNLQGLRRVAQGILKYRDPQSSWSAHYLDFRNRKSVFLCYCQTATERKRLYTAILLSFEVALMSVPAWIWIDTETNSRGGRDSAYEMGGDARRKFWIKPLKETVLRQYIYFYIFSRATLKETFTAKYYGDLLRTP